MLEVVFTYLGYGVSDGSKHCSESEDGGHTLDREMFRQSNEVLSLTMATRPGTAPGGIYRER